MQNKLLEQWHLLWLRTGAKGNPFKIWHRLVKRYIESHRHYHTLEHIDHCLDELKLSRHLALKFTTIEWALWYHDAFYETVPEKAVYNEIKSAELAVRDATEAGLPETFIEKVRNLILVTKKHKAPSDNKDVQLMVDIDLAILGQNEKRFDEYERQIRKEYEHVPYEIFRTKRIEILESFLNRKPIYSTKFFRQKYENKANENMNRSIERLQHR